jgi:hypothetical protein
VLLPLQEPSLTVIFIPLQEFTPVHEAANASCDSPVIRTAATGTITMMLTTNSFFITFRILFPLFDSVFFYASYKEYQ